MDGIIVRHSEDHDISALQQLFSHAGLSADASLPLFQSRDEVRRRISELNLNGCSLVACLADEVVGHLLLEPEQGMQRRHAASFSLCVAPEWQGKGIGSALMQAMLAICDSYWALERLELVVFSDNHRAINLYKKFGFETEGVSRKYALHNGILSDVYRMVRFGIRAE
ncbi:GNAT family N-acetyltransferase [Yokenella regensburgei]|uniref:GNAT family N-acetyltransferase n=1 Tax=Yokenella regensburgei TaxID=158877 RepID=UPI003EDAB08F